MGFVRLWLMNMLVRLLVPGALVLLGGSHFRDSADINMRDKLPNFDNRLFFTDITESVCREGNTEDD